MRSTRLPYFRQWSEVLTAESVPERRTDRFIFIDVGILSGIYLADCWNFFVLNLPQIIPSGSDWRSTSVSSEMEKLYSFLFPHAEIRVVLFCLLQIKWFCPELFWVWFPSICCWILRIGHLHHSLTNFRFVASHFTRFLYRQFSDVKPETPPPGFTEFTECEPEQAKYCFRCQERFLGKEAQIHCTMACKMDGELWTKQSAI